MATSSVRGRVFWGFWEVASLALLTILTTSLDDLSTAAQTFPQFVYRMRNYAIVSLVVAAYLPQALLHLSSVSGMKRHRTAFLECLHERLFAASYGRMDTENYRVSLFTPAFRLGWRARVPYILRPKLRLSVRSTKLHPISKLTWDMDESKAGRFDGVAGYAFATGLVLQLHDLPDYDGGTVGTRREYCKRTYITEEKAEKLNRRSRSYMATAIRDERGVAVAVLVLESTRPDGLKNLKDEELDREARHLQKLFL